MDSALLKRKYKKKGEEIDSNSFFLSQMTNEKSIKLAVQLKHFSFFFFIS